MCQFIESICVTQGIPMLLDYHQKRVDQTFNEFFLGYQKHDLKAVIPTIPHSDKSKCRIVYDATTVDMELIKYHPRNINTLKIVESTVDIDYGYKKLDRSQLESCYEQRAGNDDVIIINMGRVSDSCYANLVFYDGAKWITSDSPLLNGVKRQSLLDRGVISEAKIKKQDIRVFQKVSLINAMLDLNDIVIPIDCIGF